MWAVGRYEDVRTVLRAADRLVSGKGVAANRVINAINNEITLTADGADHVRRRLVLIKPLGPGALAPLRLRMQEEAEALVLRLKGCGTFDAMSGFAMRLPVSIVAELVGLRPEGRENMLRWAAATFDAIGPMNWRMVRALPALLDLGRYAARLDRDAVMSGSWADSLFAAADDGTLSLREAKAMIIDYVAPSLDTTILATGQLVRQLAQQPSVLEAVRKDEAVASDVVYESVRLSSPIRGFTRFAMGDFSLGDVTVPAGDRVLVLYASANRDERKYADPDRLDITRNARDHLGWGHGAHACAGMHLARLEMECLLVALARHLTRIEVDAPEPFINNVLQGYKSLPARFY
jgi:cytochrome P450